MIKLSESEILSLDLINKNIESLKSIFPEAFTESGINFDTLRQLLGDAVDDHDEKYGLNWPGKKKSRQMALTPSTGTLRPFKDGSLNWDSTQNLFIEGDNLEVLKLLQKSYAGRIKLIYIDPPYNTGGDFIYPDNFQENIETYLKYSGLKDESGNAISSIAKNKNTISSGRFHTNWLNMMYPRLMLAKHLLHKEGAIFISIDDHELSRLIEICDSIYGEENFRNIFTLRRYDKNINRQFIKDGLVTFNTGFEYVVCYAKSTEFKFQPIYREATESRKNQGYWKGFWNDADRPTMRYDILGFTPDAGQWKWSQEKSIEAVENFKIFEKQFARKMSLEEYWNFTGRKLKFIRRNMRGTGKNMGVEHWIPPSDGVLRNTNWQDIFASKSTAEIKGLFDFPKNPEAVKLMLGTVSDEDAIVLDFFAGSGTTAQAVYENNLNTNKNHKFICVQLPEKIQRGSEAFEMGYHSIADVARERIRRCSIRLKRENSGYNGDLGFKFFKLDSSNIRAWNPDRNDLEQTLIDHMEHLVEGRSEEDILYELLLKRGVDLTIPIEEKVIAGKTVYSIGYGVLFACLDTSIARDEVEALAMGIIDWQKQLEPASDTQVVFRNSAFADNVASTNMTAILEQNGISYVRSL